MFDDFMTDLIEQANAIEAEASQAASAFDQAQREKFNSLAVQVETLKNEGSTLPETAWLRAAGRFSEVAAVEQRRSQIDNSLNVLAQSEEKENQYYWQERSRVLGEYQGRLTAVLQEAAARQSKAEAKIKKGRAAVYAPLSRIEQLASAASDNVSKLALSQHHQKWARAFPG